jgi:hypothetical protein
MPDAGSVQVSGHGGGVQNLAPLLHRLSAEDTTAVNLIVGGYLHQIYELMATLDLVRTDILRILTGDHAPHPDALRVLLFPEPHRIAAQTETIMSRPLTTGFEEK